MTQVAIPIVPSEQTDGPLAHQLVDKRLVLACFVAALTYLFFAMLAGWFFSLQFLQINVFPSNEFLSPGRWRMVHTNVVLYGFLANAYLGALHWCTPRLTLHPVLSRKLSWFVFVAWQLLVVATILALLGGHAQAVEWGEAPPVIDAGILLLLAMVVVNFTHPILRVRGPMYAALWYFIVSFAWVVPLYAMGNLVPQYLAGDGSGAITKLVLYESVHLGVMPIACGLIYYFVPIMVDRPIWSHRLAMVGFWCLVIVAPWGGIIYIAPGSVSRTWQTVGTIGMLGHATVAATLIINFIATTRGAAFKVRSSVANRWLGAGMFCYLIVGIQGALLGSPVFQDVVRFSDWVIAHSHLVMFGALGFWMLGIMTHLMPRLLGARCWWSNTLNAWHFWLSCIGLLLMVTALIVAGWRQGTMWRDPIPWAQTVLSTAPFWLLRTVAGLVMIVAQLLFVWNMLMTAVDRPTRSSDVERREPHVSP